MHSFIRTVSTALVIVLISVSSACALSLEEKYPSYNYVFNEFDVDASYLYDDAFASFAAQNEKKLRSFYRRSLDRGQEILPTMQGLLVEDGVSDLFIYLSMVESGFSSEAVSPKKAVGLWQFMPATAKRFNLDICSAYDERCDTVSATSAAINYLNTLHKLFGKWYLAALAYNCGEGCVQRAISRAGTDDLSILTDGHLKYLPPETRDYIKKILLVAMIGENVTLGFADDRGDTPEERLIQVDVAAGTSLKKIAALLKMKENRLLKLNSALKDGLVPDDKPLSKIMIPIEKMYAFYLRYESPEKKKAENAHMISHYVRMGETVKSIAALYEAQSDEIRASNHLKNDVLTLDSFLAIPVSQKIFEKISE
jgi:membrane-bound lytic murein transglycosylase D